MTNRLSRLIPGLIVAILVLTACAQASPSPVATAPEVIAPTPVAVLATKTAPAPTAIPTPSATLIPYTTPEWFNGNLLYEIYVRSFVDSDGDGIGDLNGVAQKLDYLESLGVDAIWLMPIYPSPSAHGYDVTDYFAVNPDYGTLDDLQALVAAAHKRGMRVILDFVPSHLSNQNPLFQEAFKNPASERSDWFVWTNDSHSTYAGFAGNQEMPRFNHYNPEVVDYLAQAARFWLDLDGDGDYTDGIDGFRVDNITFPPQEFLVALRQAVKAADPDALMLGEAWVHNPSDLSRFFTDQFDALFDFPLYELLQGNHDTNGDGLLAGRSFPVLLTTLFADQAKRFPPEALPLRFLSNHDTNRIATELGGDSARQRLAAALLASLPGPVLLYYGEEIGMPGQKGGAPYYDNYRREPMDWYAAEKGAGQTTWFMPEDRWNKPLDGISVEEQENDPDSLLNFYRKVMQLRRGTPALSGDEFTILELEVDKPGAWGMARIHGDEVILTLFNFSNDTVNVTIPQFPLQAGELVDLLSGANYPAGEQGQPYSLSLPPASAIWLAVQNTSG